MTRCRRLTAFLLQVALLALPLSSARAECGGDHAGMTDMADMPGMTVPADTDASHHDCPADSAPRCHTMLACSAVVMTVEPLLPFAAQPQVTSALTLLARDPLSVTRAPEPPPPRA